MPPTRFRFVPHRLSFQPYPPPTQPAPQPVPDAYSTDYNATRGRLRSLLDRALADETGVEDAKMQWAVLAFWQKVFLRFGRKLIGWPPHIPFQNLSDGPVTVDDIRELIELCSVNPERPSELPQLRFVAATPEELRAARSDAACACPGPLFPAPAPRYEYRNIGRRVPRCDEDGQLMQPRYERNGPKSAKVVPDEEEESAELDVEGLQAMNTRWGVQLAWYNGIWRVISEERISDDSASECE
ncbi:hypothetical protein OH76DRAFT_1403696 [Lentinus brumalis]|uniref:Uncharacterized protein n=1 Tax=Lentinus brumalis TaxID=2498619 RepID=A0A371DAE7_9APHY|nr:hypothetical protein OH76DRAFT_1403696 [Polyporus brumalis]